MKWMERQTLYARVPGVRLSFVRLQAVVRGQTA